MLKQIREYRLAQKATNAAFETYEHLKEVEEQKKKALGTIWVLLSFGAHGTKSGYEYATTNYNGLIHWIEGHPEWLLDFTTQIFPIVHNRENPDGVLVGRILECSPYRRGYENALECLQERLELWYKNT